VARDPYVQRLINQQKCDDIEEILEEQGFTHLKVERRRGDHLVIYSKEDGQKISRARLTETSPDSYQLGFADHTGRWESTPFFGTIPELVQALIEQFSWVLTDY